ncbi:MAG: diguanylate cyclase [Candidatus Omnitrophota bacterium]
MGKAFLPKKIAPRMLIALAMASFMPILICIYLLFNLNDPFVSTILVLVLVVWFVFLGYYLASSIVHSIKNLTEQARVLALVNTHSKIAINGEDEIVELASLFNKLGETVNDAEKMVSEANQRLLSFMDKVKEKDTTQEATMQKVEQEIYLDRTVGVNRLYNAHYLKHRLNEEIAKAVSSQMPCSFIAFRIDDYSWLLAKVSEQKALNVLKDIASEILKYTSEGDTLGKLSADTLGLILPSRSKQKAFALAESVRSIIHSKGLITLSCGVSENPIDGVTAEDIFKRALMNTEKAIADGRNRVIA